MTQTYLSDALKADVNQDYLDAIDFYEKDIDTGHSSIECYSNLSFLYWVIGFQFTFRDKFEIPDSLANEFGAKYERILTAGLSHFPTSVELKFWRKYFLHRGIGDDFTFEEALAIVQSGGIHSDVPYFFLSLFDEQRFQEQCKRLYEKCTQSKTAKNLWILSLLDSNKSRPR